LIMEKMNIDPRQLPEELEVDMLKDDLSTFNIKPIGIQLVDTINQLKIQTQSIAHMKQQSESTLSNNKTTTTTNGEKKSPALFSITNHLYIFTNICSYLEPLDLVLLRLTCKYFNNLVKSPFDSITQQIWKNSRLASCEFYQLPPPLGMSEQLYINMIYTDNGCQICGDLIKNAKIYWNSLMVSCASCLNKNAISEKALRSEWDLPEAIVNVFIPITLQDLYGDYLRYYWIPSVSLTIEEYINLEPAEEKNWLKRKEIEYRFAIMTSLEREYWERCRYIKKYQPTITEVRKRKPIKHKEIERPLQHQTSLDHQIQQSEVSLYPTYYEWLKQLDILPIYENEYKDALKIATVNDEIIRQRIEQAKYGKSSNSTTIPLADTIIEGNFVSQRANKNVETNHPKKYTNNSQQQPRFRNAGYALRARATKLSSSSSSLNV
ncbi:3600_t:CDS:2, partial [Ambispora leptoticha]